MSIPREVRPLPTCAASAFGRVFYGADDRLYFSQVFLDDITVFGKCYQRNDPTAEIANDILDTDGGEVLLQDSGSIIALVPFHRGLLALCAKGVWYVSGGDTGFTATSYSVDKISSYRVIGPKAYCQVGSDVLFCSADSLFIVQNNEFNIPKVTSLTDETIKSFWQGFVDTRIQLAYDELNKKVYMLRCGCSEGRALVFDLRIQGFYPWEFKGRLHEGVLYSPQRGVLFLGRLGISGEFVSFGKLSTSAVYRDYGTALYDSYMVTNYETLGNYSRNKGTPLVNVFFRKTETQVDTTSGSLVFDKPSACNMSVLWDYDNQQGRVSMPRPIYNPVPRGWAPATDGVSSFNTGKTIVTYKDKVRGKGRAVQFRFDSVEDKGLELLGFSVQFSAKGSM
jgi:hypothetical protein